MRDTFITVQRDSIESVIPVRVELKLASRSCIGCANYEFEVGILDCHSHTHLDIKIKNKKNELIIAYVLHRYNMLETCINIDLGVCKFIPHDMEAIGSKCLGIKCLSYLN